MDIRIYTRVQPQNLLEWLAVHTSCALYIDLVLLTLMEGATSPIAQKNTITAP